MTPGPFGALVAAYHYIAILLTYGVLFGEFILYRPALGMRSLELLRTLDRFYLFGAITIILTGLLRLFTSVKGTEFYTHNPVFWVKMAMFVVVGLLSIVPTMHYIRAQTYGDVEHNRIRAFIIAQLVIFTLIPFVASLMARGVGLPAASP